MKFKKLEVAGFKSFADRLEVKFGNGITAIVGPNGCGKSNVADSIRWVLGEQSAKLLRGSSMQDVIFNGTQTRKSLSYCEVSLYFDNREKLFPTLSYEEVVLSRKLYRSGESEYYLNKTQCRLKDITDLLRDGGMGREGYSIIGQGRIDELLSAKPEDRRAIFEEAAGIAKFKARKVESERKLTRTRENLVRINDILEEKSKMLEPLTRQAESARKWLELRDRLKLFEINTYIHQYDTASIAKTTINDRLNGVLEEIDYCQKDCDGATSEYTEAMSHLGNLDKNIESLREELLTLTVGLEKQSGEMKLLNERLSYLNTQNERLKTENIALDKEYVQTLDFISGGTKLLNEKTVELDLKVQEAARFSSKYFKVVEALTSGEGEVEENHRAVLEAMDKLSDIKSNMSKLTAEKETLAKLVVAIKEKLVNLESRLAESKAHETDVQFRFNNVLEQKNEKSKKVEELNAENSALVNDISTAASELDKISAKFYMAKSKHKMLVDMQQAYEGFAYSVKNLINDSKSNKDVADKIEGVVAQIITVKPGYEVAIEMALGNAVQNIVTKNEDDAKFLIEYLKQARYGRVTFLPISSIKPRTIDGQFSSLLKADGCFGVASNLIEFEPKFKGIVEGLLGGTVIVKDMDTAISLARKSGYGFKIVTIDGDIVNPQGSITGGSKKSELTNIFGYDKEIKAMAEELESYTTKMQELEKRREEKAAKQNEVVGSLKQFNLEVHELDLNLATSREILLKLSEEVKSLSLEITQLTGEMQTHEARIEKINTDINSVGELENIITSKKQSVTVLSRERQQEFDSLRKERNALHEQMTNSRVKAASLENEVNTTESEIKRLQANILSITSKLEYNNSQIEANDQLVKQMEADLDAFTATPDKPDNAKRVGEIRARLSSLDDYKQELQLKLSTLDTKRMSLMNNLQQLSEKKNREEMLLLKVDTDIEQMQQRILEEYQMEYTDCLPFKEENFEINKGLVEINRLKRQMSSLGSVNLGAIEQCKELFESYHEMDVQREDLVKAEDDLLKIIKELSTEMLSRFSDKFEKIRTNFVKIFKELFDGGTADLILQESENPLEAGIEIVAQPPAKKLQSISLLSGGERALTAIAILFAILKLKPMPFCVLDEIEAALDDANAGRFAKYLRRFSEETQFIVITHRKPTMELADSLYGVTMEEKGVSKIVSVKLSEAVKVAAEAQ